MLLLALLAYHAVGCRPARASAACALQPGMNNHGVNLVQSAATSAQDCCSQCREASGCLGFTFVPAEGRCYVKSALGAPVADAGAVSGTPPQGTD